MFSLLYFLDPLLRQNEPWTILLPVITVVFWIDEQVFQSPHIGIYIFTTLGIASLPTALDLEVRFSVMGFVGRSGLN
jgi:hypothetical protein